MADKLHAGDLVTLTFDSKDVEIEMQGLVVETNITGVMIKVSEHEKPWGFMRFNISEEFWRNARNVNEKVTIKKIKYVN